MKAERRGHRGHGVREVRLTAVSIMPEYLAKADTKPRDGSYWRDPSRSGAGEEDIAPVSIRAWGRRGEGGDGRECGRCGAAGDEVGA